MKKLLAVLDKYLSPIGAKLGTQRHLQAIANGMMMTLPLLVIGSIFMLLANPPISTDLVDPNSSNFFIQFLLNWKAWATEYNAMILAPYNMTFGMLGLFTSFGISYSLSKHYKMDSAVNGIISASIYLLVCTTSVVANVDGAEVSAITTSYLGSDGLIVAIVLGLITVEITRLINKLGLNIKFPDSVPSMVTTFVNSLLPLFVNIALIYGFNLMLLSNLDMNLPQAIIKMLTPAVEVGSNVWVYASIIMLSNILWFLGVNGTSVIFPIVFFIGLAGTGANAEVMASGSGEMTAMNLQLFRYAMLGGAGGTLGLVALMWKSKSVKLSSLAKISIIPGACSINEPITFGVPIVYNPIMAIPYIFTPSICVLIGYYAQVLGFVNYGYVADPSFIPFFVQGWMSGGDFRNVLLMFVMIILSAVIYYPFYKVYEKVAIKQEEDAAKEENA